MQTILPNPSALTLVRAEFSARVPHQLTGRAFPSS